LITLVGITDAFKQLLKTVYDQNSKAVIDLDIFKQGLYMIEELELETCDNKSQRLDVLFKHAYLSKSDSESSIFNSLSAACLLSKFNSNNTYSS
jgi:hypothetical protein